MKGIFDKKRFEWLEEKKRDFLKNLSQKEGIKIFESLTSEEALNAFKGNFTMDNPQCLKLTLMRGKNGFTSRGI